MAESERFVPALGRERLTALYDPVIRLTTRERAFKERLLRQASVEPGMSVLDLGAGTGTLALLAKREVPSALVDGLDADPKMLERGRAKADEAGVDLHFDEGMSYELPYADGQFDRVLSTLFFHHLTSGDKRRTVREITRVLKPGGELHVADWGRPADPVMALLSLSIRLLDGAEPTRENLAGSLPAIFAEGGLESVETRGQMRTLYGTLAFYSAVRA